jgi:hypothetical protein
MVNAVLDKIIAIVFFLQPGNKERSPNPKSLQWICNRAKIAIAHRHTILDFGFAILD